MAKKDYYEILGLKKGASEAEIKKAYRRMARKHHPDVNPGDKASEEQFKQTSEAYEVLSDSGKRKQYDRFGHARPGAGGPGGGPGMGGFQWSGNSADFDFSSIFGDMFGGGPAARQGPRRGSDLEYELTISFTDAVNGAERQINYRRNAPCAKCSGQGHTAGSGGVCPQCNGRGSLAVRMGPIATNQPCPSCGGSGRTQGPVCTGCGGSGSSQSTEKLKVKIPAGVDTGSKVRISSKGESGSAGGRPGDLFIRIAVAPDERFIRQGNDIVTIVNVGLADALLGGETMVPTLTDPVRMKIPAGAQSGQRFRIKGKGVPGKGDLYAELKINIPKKLDEETIATLETLKDKLNI